MGTTAEGPPPPDLDDHRLTLDAVGIGLWRWDECPDRVELSATARQLLGAAAKSCGLAGFLGHIHGEDRLAVTAALCETPGVDGVFELECRLQPWHGAERWLRIKGRHGGRAEQPKEVRGVLMAAGPRKAAELETNRLAAIVTSSHDAIIGKTLDGIITDWNPAAETIFGYAAGEVIGKPISVLAAPDREAEMPAILARIRRGERVEHYETRRRCKDGRVIDVSITVSPVIDAQGEIVGVSKVARDITPVKRAQKELQALQLNLMQMSRLTTLGEMASTLAHELNQPLTAVANYLQGSRMLLASGKATVLPAVRDAVNHAAEQALRAGQVLRSLRDFLARGETEHSVQSLSQIIKEANALALLGVREDGILVSLDLAPEADRVSCNRVQIQQVLLNLIRNAVESMQHSAVRRLRLSSRCAAPGLVELSVHDTGHGIAPEIRDRLFNPFVTTKPEGMGVGLSLSRTIVEAHGGRLWVEPEPAGGSVFRLTLRQCEPEERPDEL